MLGLFRKWKYGNSNMSPIYVKAKDKWLYKNKWITYYLAIQILSECELKYSYTIGSNYYTTNSFSEVVDATSKHPLDISYIIPTEYSVQELRILAAIRTAKAKVYTNKFFKDVEKIEEQIKNLYRL